MIRRKITDSVYLNYIPHNRFKTNYLTVNFLVPLHETMAADNALVPQILSQGCIPYPETRLLAERYQSLYNLSVSRNRVFKRGETQIVSQSAWMLDNSLVPDGTDVLRGALDVLSDIWFHPVADAGMFSDVFTDHARTDTVDSIRAMINNKNSYAPFRCNQEMCRGEKYGISAVGSMADVEKTTPVSTFAAYERLLNSARCEIFYVGRGGEDLVADAFARNFAGIVRTEPQKLATDVIRKVSAIKEISETQPVRQSKLSLGFRTGLTEADGGRAVMLVLNEIFGSGPVSKLFMNVREKLGLCYHCSSSMDLIKGVMMVNCGIDGDKKEMAQAEILRQLDLIRLGEITEDELRAAKISLRSAIRQIYDEPSSMEMWWLGRMLSGRNLMPEEEIAHIEKITREDVAQAASGICLDTVYFMEGTGGEVDEDE